LAEPQPPPELPTLDVGDPRPPALPRYDIETEREKVRAKLALILVLAVVLATLGALLLVAFGRITPQDLPAVAGVASPLAGIAGAAIGFYFGGEPRR
jgi:hypothetical protein